jgi:ubiquitin carboxyl-terminal hydrolase L3
MDYKKHFIPLESNPQLFSTLLHELGFPTTFSFQDVLSINDPELLALVPRPALALILVFPTAATYEKQRTEENKSTVEYGETGDSEVAMWYKQTINNACGLYAILHAVSNGDARSLVGMSFA